MFKQSLESSVVHSRLDTRLAFLTSFAAFFKKYKNKIFFLLFSGDGDGERRRRREHGLRHHADRVLMVGGPFRKGGKKKQFQCSRLYIHTHTAISHVSKLNYKETVQELSKQGRPAKKKEEKCWSNTHKKNLKSSKPACGNTGLFFPVCRKKGQKCGLFVGDIIP